MNSNIPNYINIRIKDGEGGSCLKFIDISSNFGVYVDDGFSNTDVFHQKLVIICALPIAIVVIATAFWLTMALIKKSPSMMKRELVSTIIVVLFLSHPLIVQTMFKAFSCMEIDSGVLVAR